MAGKKKGGKGKSKGPKKVVEDTREVRMLLMAAEKGDVDAMEKIFSDPNAKIDVRGGTAEGLVKAAEKGQTQAAYYLLEKGVDVNVLSGKALQRACAHQHTPVVRCLLEWHADPNAKSVFAEYTALHFAAEAGNMDEVALLLDAGADVNAKTHAENCGTANGWSPIHFAADNGHLETVRYLLQNGAQIDALTASEDTALALAAERGKFDVVKFLIQMGGDVSAKRRGLTAAQWAIYRAVYEAIEFIISYGGEAKLDTKTPWFPDNMTLGDVIKRDFSPAIYEKVDIMIYRGGVKLRQRVQYKRILADVSWYTPAAYDPYSFDPKPEDELVKFDPVVQHYIASYAV